MVHVNLKPLVLLVFVIPTITTILTYYFTIRLDQTTQILPFISTTLDQPPGSCIGTGGLSITSTLIAILTIVRMVYVRAWLGRTLSSNEVRTLHKLNLIGAVVGICFALCMVGVISVQWSIDHAVHNSFAAGLFLLGTLYICIQAVMEVMMHNIRTSTRKWLLVLRVSCAVLALLLYAPLFDVILVLVLSRNHTKMAQALGAGVEITISLLFFAFYCSYHAEWHTLSLLVDIEWEEILPLMTQNRD